MIEKDKCESKKQKSLWDKIFNKDKLKKSNQIAVLFLRDNGKADNMILEPRDGFFSINNRNYSVDNDCIFLLGKNRIPLAIIPEWSLIPYGTKKWHEKDMLSKFAELQDHTLKGIRHAEYVRISKGTNEIGRASCRERV